MPQRSSGRHTKKRKTTYSSSSSTTATTHSTKTAHNGVIKGSKHSQGKQLLQSPTTVIYSPPFPKTAATHATVKAVNASRNSPHHRATATTATTTTVANPLKYSTSNSSFAESEQDKMPPLPPPVLAATFSAATTAVATITPTLNAVVQSAFSSDAIHNAPLLPLSSGGEATSLPLDMSEAGMMPHSCNLVDPLTSKMNRYVQPCALCSACRDWNAGEFCPWDLTGIIGDVSSDDSIGTCSATAASNPNLAGFESSVASEEFDAVAANASSLEEAGENVKASADMGSSHPSTASFVGAGGVPQEIGDFISEVDMTWD
eukprot:g11534.t1 g11534   contig6:21898-22954(-)